MQIDRDITPDMLINTFTMYSLSDKTLLNTRICLHANETVNNYIHYPFLCQPLVDTQ